MMAPGNDRMRMLHDIGVMGFVIVEMNEYLDTHPTDKNAMDYLAHYVHEKSSNEGICHEIWTS